MTNRAAAGSFRTRIPGPRPGLVRRPRLLAQLAERFDRRLTVVVAGAGYGKTTLLAQAIADNLLDPQGTDVWLQLGVVDRTPAYLVAGLAEALTGDPDAAADVDSLVELLLLDAPDSVVLFLDDVHLLEGAPSVAVLEALLDAMPRNAHLVLGSRTLPALSIRRRQSAGEAEVIDAGALAFTEGELAELASSLGADPSVALPSWPALAVLTGTAGRDASMGYLWEEIIGKLPAERRRALALVARLDGFDDELVRAVAGSTWTGARLVEGLPLVEVAAASWRLHDLWRTALADVVAPGEWRPALVVAAQVHRNRGELVRATVLLREAGEFDEVVTLARQYASLPISARLSRAEAEVLFDLLPVGAQAGPVGLALQSVLLWTPGEVERALTDLCERAAAEGDDEMWALGWWRRVQLQGDTDPAALEVTDELAGLADAGWPLARSAVALVRSHAAQDERDVPTALEVLDDLGGPHPLTRQVALASRHLALGQPELVAATLDEVLAEGVTDPVAAQAVWFRGDIDPDAAWPIAADLPDSYGLRRLAAVEVPLLSMVASVALAAGAVPDARSLVARARARRPFVAARLAVFADVADALVALEEEGDEAFRTQFARATDAVPLAPWPAWAYLGALAPIRALVPGAAWLDELELGPSMSTAVTAGRAIAELRSGTGRDTAQALPWSDPSLLRVHVPPSLLCELALAASPDVVDAEKLLAGLPSVATSARRLIDHPDPVVCERAAALVGRVAVRPSYELRVSALGALAMARSDGVAVESLGRRHRLRQLFGRLVVERTVNRTVVAEEMWPDLSVEQAANNLRVTLAKLLAVVEPDRVDGTSWWIRAVDERLELADDGLVIDVDEFEAHLRSARSAEAQRASSLAYDHYLAAIDCYGGALLPDIDEAWVVHERLRLHSLAYAAACRLAEFDVARGEPERAMEHAGAALRIDPLGERAHRLLIGCHMALGATDAARATAEEMAQRLGTTGTDLDLLRRLARTKP